MDVSVVTGVVPPASAELTDTRGGQKGAQKGEDAGVLPFEAALASEMEELEPTADLPADKDTETGEAATVVDAPTSADASKAAKSDLPLPVLTAADLAGQSPVTPTTQLVLPPLTPAMTQTPAADAASETGAEVPTTASVASTTATSPTAASTASTSAAATAALVPLAMTQARAGEATTGTPAERTGERPGERSARIASPAALANAMAATPGEKTIEAPHVLPAPAFETAMKAQPAMVRPRAPELAQEPAAEKTPVRADYAQQASPVLPAAELERAAVRVEQSISVEGTRPEPAAMTAASTPSASTPQPSAFTTPQTAQYTAPQPPVAVTAHIQTPFGHAEWADQLREKVVWLVDRQQQAAELHIHPPHLGPVEVMLTLNDDKTSIAFVSPHPAVREAIEASFSDLRSTLEQRGLALGHASVSADQREAREQLPQDAQPGRRFPGGTGLVEEAPIQRVLTHRGLVDTFA